MGNEERKMLKWEILHMPDKLSDNDELSTVDVLAAAAEPQVTNTLIRKLNQVAPLVNLRHVKRVQKRSIEGKSQLSVILCLSSGNEILLDNIPNDVLDLINAYQLCPYLAKVARHAATSKEEWEEQCKLWPTSYHAPTYNIDGITGFSEDDSEMVFKFMEDVFDLSKSVDQVVNAAIIVDPLNRQVIATACDQTCVCKSNSRSSSGKERELACIPLNVNDAEGGESALLNCSNGDPSPSCSGVACVYPWHWTGHQCLENSSGNCASIKSWNPLRHAAMVAIGNAAARDLHLFPNSQVQESQTNLLNNSDFATLDSPAKRQKVHALKQEDGMLLQCTSNCLPAEVMRPYLCTGFDIYLAWEPCTMCAMALVHQRIRRIFYAFPNLNAGALGSVYRLQGEKSLNHHYAVFRVVLPKEVLYQNFSN